MNEYRILFSLLFVCFFTCGSYCQDVQSILDKHYDAWGQELISTIRTYELEMSEVRGFLDRKQYKITRKRPEKVRIDGTWKDQSYIQSYNGAEYWTIAPWRGSNLPDSMSHTEIQSLVNSLHIDSPLFLAQKEGVLLEYIGEKANNDLSYFVIRLKHLEDRWLDYFLDQETYQIFKTVERDSGNEDSIYKESFFKNYKPQAGVNMAMEYEIRSNGSTINLIVISVVLGHGVPNTFFNKPVD